MPVPVPAGSMLHPPPPPPPCGAVFVGDAVGVFFGVFVDVGLGVFVGVAVLVIVDSAVAVAVAVAVFVAVLVSTAVAVFVATGVRVFVGVATGVSVAVGEICCTVTLHASAGGTTPDGQFVVAVKSMPCGSPMFSRSTVSGEAPVGAEVLMWNVQDSSGPWSNGWMEGSAVSLHRFNSPTKRRNRPCPGGVVGVWGKKVKDVLVAVKRGSMVQAVAGSGMSRTVVSNRRSNCAVATLGVPSAGGVS